MALLLELSSQVIGQVTNVIGHALYVPAGKPDDFETRKHAAPSATIVGGGIKDS
jgi:hypothetical protein